MSDLEPIQLEQVRICHFKAKTCATCDKPKSNAVHRKPDKGGTCKFRRRNGCVTCGKNKGDPDHFGAPPSFNAYSSGDPSVYMTLKEQWQAIFADLLKASGLPRGLGRVFAEGEITFPDRRDDRDQGNFRVVIEKALGDALEAGGWLERDDWTHYEFGGLTQRYQQGESATRVVLFPAWPTEVGAVADAEGLQGSLLFGAQT